MNMLKENSSRDIVLIIHNVRGAANVGSMFRSADGAGVREIWLTGYTPCPAGPDRKYLTKAEKSLAKTALGAENSVVWRKETSFRTVAVRLRASGYRIVGLEQDEKSVSLRMIRKNHPVALVVGNEVKGLHRLILDQCDVIGELPMYGKKNSLNVSVACGIALYTLRGIME